MNNHTPVVRSSASAHLPYDARNWVFTEPVRSQSYPVGTQRGLDAGNL